MTKTQHLGRYRVLCPLGQGRMGMVYLARDPVLSRLVAVKVIHPDLLLQEEVVQRFFQEAKVAARSQSPHIVNIHDLGRQGNSPFMVMEFIDGQPLQRIMEFQGGEPLPPIVAASIICQAAEGASMAAEAGVIHRDLKPANLMVTGNGYVKITDFGICHLSDHTLTRTGQVLGSPRFMSPEQVQGLKDITPQADLFSMGAVLYYCLSGKAPFQAETTANLYRQITEEPHPPLEEYRLDLDPFLIQLVDTLLEKDPAKRGKGPRWLRFQLKRYLHHQRVIDPAERVASFVRELSSQGFQTTSDFSRSEIRHLEGSFDFVATPRIARKKWPVLIGISALLGIVGAGSLYLLSEPQKTPVAGRKESEAKAESIPSDSALDMEATPSIPDPEAVRMEDPTLGESEVLPASQNLEVQAESDTATVSVLSIITSPPFAEVTLDGQPLGRTPIEGKTVPAGRYRMLLKSPTGIHVDTTLAIDPGPQRHKFTLLSNPEVQDE